MKIPEGLILSYKCKFCGKSMSIEEDLASLKHVYIHTDCLIKDIEKQLNDKIESLIFQCKNCEKRK